jgi:hypothetical protein
MATDRQLVELEVARLEERVDLLRERAQEIEAERAEVDGKLTAALQRRDEARAALAALKGPPGAQLTDGQLGEQLEALAARGAHLQGGAGADGQAWVALRREARRRLDLQPGALDPAGGIGKTLLLRSWARRGQL